MVSSENNRHVEFIMGGWTDWNIVNKHNGTCNINYLQRQ